MLVGIHSEDVAKEPPTDGGDVSPVTDLFIGYFHRPVDLYEPSQTLMKEYIQLGQNILGHTPRFTPIW